MAIISSLATSKYITDKHHSREGNKIKFVIPHHMAARSTGAQCANYFVNNTKGTSANYCIGYDGDISCNVPEEYGAFTSGSQQADKRAITIEVSDTSNSDWTIPEKAQQALIQLLVDIFKRNPSLGLAAVYDLSDKERVEAAKNGKGSWDSVKGNIIIHQWTTLSGTSCPEWHMKKILPDLLKEVNKRLGAEPTPAITVREEAQACIDGKKGNYPARKTNVEADGLNYTEVQKEVDLMLAKDINANVKCFAEAMPVIKKGSKGDTVTLLQKMLKDLGFYTDTIDGQAGSNTVKAIKAAQKAWGIKVDGYFGPDSWTTAIKEVK